MIGIAKAGLSVFLVRRRNVHGVQEDAQGAAGAAGASGATGSAGGSGAEAKKDDSDVVDAEFTEVKDKK